MWQHSNGRITVACFSLYAYIFAGLVQVDTLPWTLTSCNDNNVIEISVSDLSKIGYTKTVLRWIPVFNKLLDNARRWILCGTFIYTDPVYDIIVWAMEIPINSMICIASIATLNPEHCINTVNLECGKAAGDVLISYGHDIKLNFHNSCATNYLRINSSESELVLSRNLTTFCNQRLECALNCIQGSNKILHLLVNIIRNASYNMDFRKTSYSASIRELTPETQLYPAFKDELIMRECQAGSLLLSPTFYINKTTKEGWFTTKDIVIDGIIYSTSEVDYEQLHGTTNVILTIRGEQTLDSVTNLTAYTDLIVTIEDVDDMNPVFTEDVYHLNISETKLGLDSNPYKTSPQIYAYDGDRGLNETILYSIKDDMKSKFSINNMSGEISVLQELDADGGQDRYVIIIQATQEDNPFRSATCTLSLNVIDIDDNLPVFDPNNYNCSITEHSGVGQVICKVNATDKDKGQNGQFSYELTNGNAVDIDPISGYIYVKDSQMLDREKESHLFLKEQSLFLSAYQIISCTKYDGIQVIAKSSDGNMTDEANITINLIDINDNSPVFKQSSYNFIVQNISIGGYVGKINAIDLDSGDNQKLNYSWGTCLSNSGFCSGDNMNCQFPFIIDPESGTITLNGCTADCIFSTLVSVCDSSHYFQRFCTTTLLVIRVEDSSPFQIFNRRRSVQENAANSSTVAQVPDGFDLINGHCIKRKSVKNEPDAVSTVLIVSTVLGSTVAVIVVGVTVYYCLILRRRRAKSDKETRETAYPELQEMEARKENHSNIEEIYDVITHLPDDYLTAQNIIPTVDESEDRVGSYEKLRIANQNMSEGYSYLSTPATDEYESNARKYENTEYITPTGETNVHSKPDDDHTNTD